MNLFSYLFLFIWNFLLQMLTKFDIMKTMLKKVYYGKFHRKSEDADQHQWFFYSLNTKLKELKPRKRTKKSKLWSLLFFLLNLVIVGVVLAIQINSEAGVGSIKELFSGKNNPMFILISLACFLGAELLIGLRLNLLTKNFHKKGNYFACLKSEFECQYYNKITPFSVGGQPFQVYSLNKSGVKANNAITIVSCNYISHKLIYWLVSLFVMFTIFTNGLVKMMSGADFNIVLALAIFSLSFMSIYLTFVILVCVNKKIASNLVAFAIKILYKLKVVKNRKNIYLKIMRPALAFQHKMKNFFKNKKLAFLSLLLSLVAYLVQSSVPACIYFIFEPFNLVKFWQLLSIAVLIQLSFGVNPIPGGSGVAELSFNVVFAVLIDNTMLFWALILWRILTYYIYIALGIGIVSYNYALGQRRRKKKRIENIVNNN